MDLTGDGDGEGDNDGDLVDTDGDGVVDDDAAADDDDDEEEGNEEDPLLGDEQTPEPSAEAAAECFPADATVELRDGRAVRMADLAVGDVIRVAPGATDAAYSAVYFFSHRTTSGTYGTVRLTTADGATVEATPGHYVYASGRLVAAAAVAVGDTLTTADGAAARVVATTRTTGTGLYNPHTLHGDMYVDGLRVSTYTTAVEPGVARALLAPLRAAYSLAGVTAGALSGGAPAAVTGLLPRGRAVCAEL